MQGSQPELIEWIMSEARPIIRWRLVRNFNVQMSDSEKSDLPHEALSTDEASRWLDYLGKGPIHHSKDTAAENALAKLVEYGFRAGMPEFDEKALPYVEKIGEYTPGWAPCSVGGFLIAAGYEKHPAVRKWFLQRLETLYEIAVRGSYDFHLPPEETRSLPKPWCDKPIYRPEFCEDGWCSFPSIYDLCALSHWPCSSPDERKKIGAVIAYISDPVFQSKGAGYVWVPALRRAYASCNDCRLTPDTTVLYLELTAKFAEAREAVWFQEALSGLEQHRTREGRYCFPAECLKEVRNSYHLRQGAHMGLGENRRSKNWCEIESTFRMLNIRRLTGI